MEYSLRTRLAANGFEMSDFRMSRPYNWAVLIESIQLASPGVLISLSGIEISPLSTTGSENLLTVRRATFQATSSENDTASSLTWRDLIESIGINILLLPHAGGIEYLQYCLQVCLEGRLNWNRIGNELRVQFLIPALGASGSLIWMQGKSTIFIAGTKDNRFFLQVDLAPGAREINIEGQGLFLAVNHPVTLHRELPFQYQLDIYSASLPFSGHLPLDGIVSIDAATRQLQARLNASGHASMLVKASRLNLSGDQLISADIEILHGVLKPRLTRPVEITVRTPAIEHMTLTIDAGAECHIDNKTRCTSPDASLAGLLDSYDVFAAFSGIQFNLDDGISKLSATVALDLADGDTSLITAELALTAEGSEVRASAQAANFLGLSTDTAEVVHNLASARGHIRTNMTSAASKIQSVINYLEIDDLTIGHGKLSIESNIAWDLTSDDIVVAFDSTLGATNLEVAYGDYSLHEGTFSMELSGWPTIISTHPANMSWKRFDIGVPIENLRLEFNLSLQPSKGTFTVTGLNLDAAIFDGQLGSTNYDYEIASSTGHIDLNLKKLQLNQILALHEEKFESAGMINGSVPVHINQGKLSVSKGTITAIDPGGYIKYRPSPSVMDLVAQNKQLTVVVDTMSDFQYHSLDAELTYSPEGDLVARTALKGSNPAYENGREIHLNVEVVENLATLLESLRLSDEITEKFGAKAKSGVRQ